MYANRPLSTYKRNPSALSSPPLKAQILNKNLTVTTRRTGNGKNLDNKVIFIPVLNQPLEREGLENQNPEMIDRHDFSNSICALNSALIQGSTHREVSASTTTGFELKEAAGLDRNLRARLPDFNLPLSQRSSAPVVVGSWCCPFMFIKEGKLKDQMSVSRETAAVAGREAAPDRRITADGVMWFRSSGDVGGGASVGLSLEIVEGMKWEGERGGWLGGDETEVTAERVEEFGGIGGWKKFGCYVLVERFVFRREWMEAWC
ncbi:hypothetical protein OIU84_000074 [Salix udensis]|uniref:Uncharacterized protein n=1 Tax=Salix udensis TaxID=889485 RepID=A0AAD6L3Z6_9ROSI|nr:hypothetical protein OIU84_000074 [Salix udensis]